MPLFASTPQANTKFRVAICGAGIGGLVLALVLAKSNVDVVVYEAGQTITTTGAGITLFARASELVRHLGLADELAQYAIHPPLPNTGPCFFKGDLEEIWFEKILQLGPLHLHRHDLVDVLLRHVSSTIHLGRRLVSWSQDPNGVVALRFADGTTAEADVLVGADGIRSATRRSMYESMAEKDDDFKRFVDPLWTGIYAYRSLIPVDKLGGMHIRNVLTYYLGHGQHLVIYPVSQGRLLNVIVYVHHPEAFDTPCPANHWALDVDPDERAALAAQFTNWNSDVKAIIEALENPTRWALHVVRKLPHYVSGSVVLVGDAAHAMEPHFGAGAAQAIEDAFVLGRILAHPRVSRDNIQSALRIFERVRQPFAQDVVEKSQRYGRLLAFRSTANDQTFLPHESDEDLDRIRQTVQDEWEWQNRGGALKQWDDAERMLDDLA